MQGQARFAGRLRLPEPGPVRIGEGNGVLRDAPAQFTVHAPNTWTCLDAGNRAWIGATPGRSTSTAREPGRRTASR
ncbi:hypothetical protein [Streptomyces parvus]|uniref:hypothetical protein n=1 Tax=Streptomyces parvus TaxID=66428 RepID=UPI0036EFCE83